MTMHLDPDIAGRKSKPRVFGKITQTIIEAIFHKYEYGRLGNTENDSFKISWLSTPDGFINSYRSFPPPLSSPMA